MPNARPSAESRLRWVLPAALLTVAPKCLACVLAYAGLGAALGLTAPELCGGSAGPRGDPTLLLIALGLVAAAIFLVLRRRAS